MGYSADKAFRILSMYRTLVKGDNLRKSNLSKEFNITFKTVQRDIDSLRFYLAETHDGEVVYDRENNHYTLSNCCNDSLTMQEIYVLCKILIESRAFNRSEFELLIKKLLLQVPKQNRSNIKALLGEEYVGYLPLRHGKPLIDLIWKISSYVTSQKIIKIKYKRQDNSQRMHIVKPVGIMFSEYYFYLIAYLADNSKDFPTIFRIDRIAELCDMAKTFRIPHRDRFSESEFRKRIQFMYTGELKTIEFIYKGQNIDTILDKLPTAIAKKNNDSSYLVHAEVFGNGIDMWLQSQKDWITICK